LSFLGKPAAGSRRPLSRFFYFYPFQLLARDGHNRSDPAAKDHPRFAQFWCNITPLDATLLDFLVCVANKGLTEALTLLVATLTQNTGGSGVLWLTSG
jgi:hypothetical protein